MFENSLQIILVLNSIFLLLFLFNQNESPKDVQTSQNSSSNPLEFVTWIGFSIQIMLLFFMIKA